MKDKKVGRGGAGGAAAFVDVNVVPMDEEGVLRGQTVLVRGEKIAEMGHRDAVEVPKGALWIDGRGKYLMPGLVDMHVHLDYEGQFELWMANGVTTVRNMWGMPEILETRRRIEEGEILGPRIFTSGPILNNVGATCVPVESPERGREIVAEIKEAGYDFVKVYDAIPKAAYEAIIEAAREHDIPVIGHVPLEVGIERALASGMHCVEHLTGYDLYLQREDSPLKGNAQNPARFAGWAYADERKIGPIAKATAKAGTWNSVSLTVFKNKVTRAEMERELEKPFMRYVPAKLKERWFTGHSWVSRMTEEAAEAVRKGAKSRGKLIRALKDAGEGIVLGTDDPDPLLVSGFCVHQELSNLVEAGLTPYEAMRAATRDAAECLGAGDRFGAVKAGLGADLILTDGNPLEDVGNAGRLSGVMLRGRWLPRRELRMMLERLAEANASD